jgi:hypothetical protein
MLWWPRPPYTNSINVDRAEDGFERSPLQAAVLEQGEGLAVNDGQSRKFVFIKQ